jgi:hypothetical protein
MSSAYKSVDVPPSLQKFNVNKMGREGQSFSIEFLFPTHSADADDMPVLVMFDVKQKIDRSNTNIGANWLQWWFGSSKNIKRKNGIYNSLKYYFSKYARKVIGSILLLMTATLVIKLNYDIHLHDYLNVIYPPLNSTMSTIYKTHPLSNTDFILLGIDIGILLLPVISKLKIADVEIEIPVESKGDQIYQLMPYTNSLMRKNIELNNVDRHLLKNGLVFIDLWY